MRKMLSSCTTSDSRNLRGGAGGFVLIVPLEHCLTRDPLYPLTRPRNCRMRTRTSSESMAGQTRRRSLPRLVSQCTIPLQVRNHDQVEGNIAEPSRAGAPHLLMYRSWRTVY